MVCHQLKTVKQNFSEVTRLKNVTCQLLIDEVYCQSGQSHSGNEGAIGSVFWPGMLPHRKSMLPHLKFVLLH